MLEEKPLQNSQSLWNFCFWDCKEVALSLIRHNLSVSCGKSSDYAHVDVSKFNAERYVSPHPVICPVKRGRDISRNRNQNCLRPNGRMCD